MRTFLSAAVVGVALALVGFGCGGESADDDVRDGTRPRPPAAADPDACSAEAARAAKPMKTSAPRPCDLASVVDALRAQGIPLSPGATVEQPFLSVPGRRYGMRGGTMQLFEYPSDDAARADAARISPDGYSVRGADGGMLIVEWTAPPHFFRAGRALVLYLGEDRRVLNRLRAALGPEFAGRR